MTATPEIYTLSLHDALPICLVDGEGEQEADGRDQPGPRPGLLEGLGDHGVGDHGEDGARRDSGDDRDERSEEHTSELQSRQYLVCRLLLEKKKARKRKLHTK